jgi:hypothetical protein
VVTHKEIELISLTRIFSILGGEVTLMLAGGGVGLLFIIFS